MKLIFTILLILSIFLPPSTNASDWKISVGQGFSFGGLIGGQFAYEKDGLNIYSAIGLTAYSFGAEYALFNDKRHSIDANVGQGVDFINRIGASEGFISFGYKYNFSGFNNEGWVLGLSYVHAKGGDEGDWWSEETDNSNLAINFAYKF